MRAALIILRDVLIYRLRRLEMANFVAAVAIMLALRLPAPDVAIRSAFAFLLNLLAYLNNDYCDVDHDLATGRDVKKTRFLADHRTAAARAQVVIFFLLAAVAVTYAPGLLIALCAGAGICWWYSALLKVVPLVDILAMAAWGIAMTLVAFPLDSALGWALVIQLGLFSAVFESIQVIRDREEDAARGVRTTAVVFGVKTTLRLCRLFMVLCSVYAVLVLHRYIGLLMLPAVLIPFDPARTERFWTRVRFVLGIAWLGLLAWVFVHGSSAGLVFRVLR